MKNWIYVDLFISKSEKLYAVVKIVNRAKINTTAHRKVQHDNEGYFIVIHGEKNYFYMPLELKTIYKDDKNTYLA
ncbi:hypothetical protein EBB07_29325 [Paenibacillaceae bacterium]|nr:hypothetical protein EBB07_29325 [Paenibacillaceae bacterium]